jgi:hypothetical protein
MLAFIKAPSHPSYPSDKVTSTSGFEKLTSARDVQRVEITFSINPKK